MTPRTSGTIIFVTQLIDPDDPVLGFVVPQIEALAARCERLVVIANEVRAEPSTLSCDVVSLGKEHGAGRLRRGLRYELALVRSSRGPRPVTIVAHMCPEYLNLAVPVARLRRLGTVLWYTHPSRTPTLVRAERHADCVLTALPGSYPGSGPKVHAIGHSIDMARFPVTDPRATAPRQLLALGRTSPVKGYRELVEAVALARDRGADLRLAIVGPSTTEAERQHRAELDALIRERGLGAVVRLEEGVSPQEVPDLLQRSTALVNLTSAGSADKVVFEAMAAGRPVIVREAAFAELVHGAPLDLTCNGDAASASERLVELAYAFPEQLAATGRFLRERVEQAHSMESWVTAVLQAASDVRT